MKFGLARLVVVIIQPMVFGVGLWTFLPSPKVFSIEMSTIYLLFYLYTTIPGIYAVFNSIILIYSLICFPPESFAISKIFYSSTRA